MNELVKINQGNHDTDNDSLAIERYNCLLAHIQEELLSNSDRRTIMESGGDWQPLQVEIQRKRVEPTLSAGSKRYMSLFDPLPRTLNELVGHFKYAVHPHTPDVNPLWGLWYLNLKLCYDSPEKLKRTSGWVGKVRRILELCNRSLDACIDHEMHEARIALVEILGNPKIPQLVQNRTNFIDPLFFAFTDSIKFLRSTTRDSEVNSGWPRFEAKIEAHLLEIGETVKHLNEIRVSSFANQERIQQMQR